MNQDQLQHPTTNSFEDRLLAEMRAVVAERGAAAAEAEASTAAPAWRRGPRLAIAGAAVATVAAAALIVSAGGSDTPAAYAVEPESDGEVRVEIRSLEDAKGLEDALVAAGIPASVDYLATGMVCKEPRFKPVAGAPGDGFQTSSVTPTEGGGAVFTISRNTVDPGQTLVVTASTGPGGSGSSLQMSVAEGKVGNCEPVKGEAVPPPGAETNQSGPSDVGPVTSSGAEKGFSTSRGPAQGFSTGGSAAKGSAESGN